MRDLTLAIPQGFSKRKTQSISTTVQINFLLLILIVLLTGAYLFLVNSIGTKGYEIKKLEQQLAQLEFAQKKLQVQSSDLQSITKLQEVAQSLNFVPAQNPTYLRDHDYALK